MPWALSGPDASSGRQGDKCGRRAAGQRWPRPRPRRSPGAQGSSRRARRRALLRAGLCALISQVRGWTGPWPAQPATPCDSCCPVRPAPRSLPLINGARGWRGQTAPLRSTSRPPRTRQAGGSHRGTRPPRRSRPRRPGASPDGRPRPGARSLSWFLFPMHILL